MRSFGCGPRIFLGLSRNFRKSTECRKPRALQSLSWGVMSARNSVSGTSAGGSVQVSVDGRRLPQTTLTHESRAGPYGTAFGRAFIKQAMQFVQISNAPAIWTATHLDGQCPTSHSRIWRSLCCHLECIHIAAFHGSTTATTATAALIL